MTEDKTDGSLAWGVAFAACMINFIIAGLGRMSGILYVAFIEMFGISRGLATTPFSVRSSTRNLLGPVVGILGQQFGVRAVTISGGVIGAAGTAACYFAPDIKWITIIWGGISGVGTAMTTTLPQVVIGQYFKKYRTTASGLAFSGGCVGAFLFPVLLEYLLHNYDLQSTFLIIGGITMHVIPAAMLLRKPPWMKAGASHDTKRQSHMEQQDSKILYSQDTINGRTSESQITLSKERSSDGDSMSHDLFSHNLSEENTYIEILYEIVKYTHSLEQHSICDTKSLPSKEAIRQFLSLFKFSDTLVMSTNCNSNSEKSCFFSELSDQEMEVIENVLNKLNNEIVLKSVLEHFQKISTLNYQTSYELNNLENSIQTLLTWHKHKSFHKENENNAILQVQGNGDLNNEVSSPRNKIYGFLQHFKTALKLYTNPIFHLICLCRTMHFLTFIPVTTVVVDFGMDKGLPEEDGKYIIAALSAGDLIGRVGLGWITDKGYMQLTHYMLLTMILQGLTTISLPFVHGVGFFLTVICIFGMLQGSVFVRHPVLVTKYMDTHEQSIAMGCINFLSGFVGFGLPAYIGYFRDDLGSYDRMFFITGSLGMLVGSFWIFEPKFARYISARRTIINTQNA